MRCQKNFLVKLSFIVLKQETSLRNLKNIHRTFCLKRNLPIYVNEFISISKLINLRMNVAVRTLLILRLDEQNVQSVVCQSR